MKALVRVFAGLIVVASGAVFAPVLAESGPTVVFQSAVSIEFTPSVGGCPTYATTGTLAIEENPDGSRYVVLDQQGQGTMVSGTLGPEGFAKHIEGPYEVFSRGELITPTYFIYDHECPGSACGWREALVTLETPWPEPAAGSASEDPVAGGSNRQTEADVDTAPARSESPSGEPEKDAGGVSPTLIGGLVIVVVVAALLAGLLGRTTSDDDNWFWTLVKGLLRIRGRKGRMGSSVDMKTVEEAVETVEEVAPDIGEKQKMAEQKQAQDEALGEDPPPDSHDTGIPFVNWVAGHLFDTRYSAEEREKREQERKEKARRKKYEEWQRRPESHSQYCGFHQPGVCHGECPPSDYSEATPEQLAEFDEWLGEAAPAQ